MLGFVANVWSASWQAAIYLVTAEGREMESLDWELRIREDLSSLMGVLWAGQDGIFQEFEVSF